MAGLTVHNFVSAATGIALAIALIRGFARRSAQDHRQFLGRSDPLHALRPAADLDRRRHWCWSGRACRRICGAYTEATTLEGAKQMIAQGRSPRRTPSRSSAPTAAASSTPTRPIPSRIPNAFTNLDRDVGDLRDRRGADLHLRPHGRQHAPGLGDLRGHEHPVPRRRADLPIGPRAHGNPAVRRARRRPAP